MLEQIYSKKRRTRRLDGIWKKNGRRRLPGEEGRKEEKEEGGRGMYAPLSPSSEAGEKMPHYLSPCGV